MSPDLNALLAAWVASEPIVSSVMFIAAILLFWTSFARIWSETPVLYERIWRVFRLVASVALFLCLLWGFYFLLKSNSLAFHRFLVALSSNSAPVKAQNEIYTRWGRSFIQNELTVNHFARVEFIEEIQQGKDVKGKQKPALYLKREREELIQQESLSGFAGDVQIHVVDFALGKLEIQANYRYTAMNPSQLPTLARFSFPFAGSRLYENLSVRVDGRPVELKIESDALKWATNMAPQQSSIVEISYRIRAADTYQYNVTSQRVLQNFSLTVSVDLPDAQNIRYSISPASKSVKFTQEMMDHGYRLNWFIDRAIITPAVTVQIARPPTNVLSTVVIYILDYAGRSLVLLLSLITLTLVLFNLRVDLARLTLLAAIFVAQFLLVSVVYSFLGIYNLFTLIFGFCTVVACFFIFRQQAKLPLVLILCLTLIFAVMYPFAGLLPGEREKNSLDGAIQAGMILYVFVLTFYMRLRPAKRVK